jgi:glutamate N-acetyltransferase/amino-acid N-acetyltransferase
MIHPDMATMMAFLACDADIEPELLREALVDATERSFNRISVDGDTSTNDMVVILCNGLAGNRRIDDRGHDYQKFARNLERICVNLAKAIVSDGEGTTKFVEYRVVNAGSVEDARNVLRTVSNSNLVRTALFGRDPNWGRILAAVGRSGVDIDPERVDISIGSKKYIPVARGGRFVEFNRKQLKQMMKSARLKILIDLHMGDGWAVGWGSDFSYEYVRINAEYTT